MQLILKLKNVYGVIRFYPTCDVGKKLANWVHKKTLNLDDIDVLKSIGYEVFITDETGTARNKY